MRGDNIMIWWLYFFMWVFGGIASVSENFDYPTPKVILKHICIYLLIGVCVIIGFYILGFIQNYIL